MKLINLMPVKRKKIISRMLIMGALSASSLLAYAQHQQVILSGNNLTLKEAFEQIERQTNLFIDYNVRDVNDSRIIQKLPARNEVQAVLNELLEGTGCSARFSDGHIIITRTKSSTEKAKKKVTGTVSDENGEPIIGANVVEKGTTNGTITDMDGRFTLDVTEGTTLQISYIGYKEREIKAGNRPTLSVVLAEDTENLDEVVVIGYGTVKKRDLTGAVSSVKSDALMELPTNNISQALQGRVPGVQIQQNSGEPGGNMQIRIRGANSISGDNEPLWIINGFPGDQTMLNSSDIESIEVLKDASATAIYGSRGANGVILVTTKQAREGRVSVDYEGSYSVQTVRKRLDLMNATEYADYYNTFWKNTQGENYFTDSEIASFGEGTDWQDLIFQPAEVQDHSLTVSGGSDKTQFSVGTSYFNQEGLIKKNKYQRIVVRASLNHNLNDKFSISYNSILSRTNQHTTNPNSILLAALSATPTVGPYTDDGEYQLLTGIYPFSPDNLINPIAYFNEVTNRSVNNKVMANIAVTYKPIKDLSIKISGNISNTDYRNNGYTGVNYPNSTGSASLNSANYLTVNSDNIVTYNKTFNKDHTLTATGAFTYERYTAETMGVSGSGFLSDAAGPFNISSATTFGVPSSSYTDWTLLSWLGRFNYSYKDKYLVTVSFRADGSSRYSEGNKWGFFPSGALAWRFSEEGFMKDLTFLSNAKLRIGWGQTGSTAISPYYTLNMLSSGKVSFDDALYTYYAPGTRLPSDLKWETTSQTDIGLDLGFWDNRIRFTADFYLKNTRDLLNTVQLPSSLGYTTTVRNVGKVRNKGFEFQVDANLFDGEFKWDVTANLSLNRNKVIKLQDGQDIPGSTYNLNVANDYINILREGYPMSIFYGYQVAGFDDEGHFTYRDNNNDGSITEADKTIIGDPNPDFIYGLSSNMSWKNFEFNFFLQGSQGNDIYSFSMITQNYKTYIGYNALKEVYYNHWTPENPGAKYPVVDNVISTKMADNFVYNGSYLRLKNIKLAYNVPVDKLGIDWLKRGQIYVSGQNLLTVTKYPWWDPEVNSKGGSSSINQGIDDYSYPTAKGFTVGVKLTF